MTNDCSFYYLLKHRFRKHKCYNTTYKGKCKRFCFEIYLKKYRFFE